jgi:hypothetical protein
MALQSAMDNCPSPLVNCDADRAALVFSPYKLPFKYLNHRNLLTPPSGDLYNGYRP